MVTFHLLNDESGTWRVSLHQANDRPEGAPHGSGAICMIDARHTVVVRNVNGRWSEPSGRAEPGESSEQTMVREVREEACADVRASLPIGYTRSEKLDGDNAGFVMVRDMYVAMVDLAPWVQPQHEIAERGVVPLASLAQIIGEHWPGADEFFGELVAKAQAALPQLLSGSRDS